MIRLLVVGFIVGATLAVAWMSQRLGAYDARCRTAGGSVRVFGPAIRFRLCLSSDGRVLEIEGP